MKDEERSINLMQATYADVLFVLFPFLAMLMQRLWNGENASSILRAPDLSIAATVLAGLAVGKFVLGLISDPGLARYKERIVFFIALDIFFCLGPGVILILKIVSHGNVPETVPELVTYIQPVLLIIAITLYSAAVNVSHLFADIGLSSDSEETAQEGDHVFDFSALESSGRQRERDSV
ncbi:MAG: hypothetical protein D6758_10490 [Gammaproteobacteria bacterium]|nr:MAG: hypothetical protein D6758_10490 [Gammaproteobacteria bacterium]